jgi:hypothetical protein
MPFVNERCNAFPYLVGKNSSSSVLFSKPAGYTKFNVRVSCFFLHPIAAGKVVELNCVIFGTRIGGFPIGNVYRRAIVFNEDTPALWREVNFPFRGWPEGELVMHVTLERRNDATTHGPPSESMLLIRRTSGVSEV